MIEKIARNLVDILKKSPYVSLFSDEENIIDFHQWSEGKEHLATFAIKIAEDVEPSFYFQFIDWKGRGNYYLVVFPQTKVGPVLEIHNFDATLNRLSWKYKPTKQDGKNQSRCEYFCEYNGALEVVFPLPKNENEVGSFIESLARCALSRIKADNIDRVSELNSRVIIEEEDQVTPSESIRDIKNFILFGPPGTGKTFITRKHAVDIISGPTPQDSEEAFLMPQNEKAKIAEVIKKRIIVFSTENVCDYLIRKDYIQFRLWKSKYRDRGLHFEVWTEKMRFMLDYEPERADSEKKDILKDILTNNITLFKNMGPLSERSSIGNRLISSCYSNFDELIPDFVTFVQLMMAILKKEGFIKILQSEEKL